MAMCTCFSVDGTVRCDHKRSGDDDLMIEISDDAKADDDVTVDLIDDSDTITVDLGAKAIECPKGRWCMRGVNRSVKECAAKPGQCPVRDKSKATGKGFDFDNDRMAAAMAASQSISSFYEDQYYTARSQDRLWEQLRQLHRTVKARPLGLRQVVDFGDGVPPELRYLIY